MDKAEYVRLVRAEAALLEQVKVLRDYALMDAHCPCCQRVDVCEDDCTFAHDQHTKNILRMEAARDALKVKP